MPILQFRCPSCGKEFEELVQRYDEKVTCPDCGRQAERSYSGTMFSATGTHAKRCSGNCKTCGGCK